MAASLFVSFSNFLLLSFLLVSYLIDPVTSRYILRRGREKKGSSLRRFFGTTIGAKLLFFQCWKKSR